MKELKSKKTGKVEVISDEDYIAIVRKGVIDLKKFYITDLKIRTIIPSLRTEVKPPIKTEVKAKIKNKEDKV